MKILHKPRKKVAIQGIRGAFHEAAAQQWFSDVAIEIVPMLLFEDMIKALVEGTVDQVVMAIENTISGTIHENFRLLSEYPVEICGETSLRIEQNLGVLPGTKLEDLVEVRSHYMAINQCRKYFEQYPHIKLVEDIDTALSAKMVADRKLSKVGAIGSSNAMTFYGLEIIGKSIETNKQNYTRFFILQKATQQIPKDYNKVSLNLILPHQSGSLYNLLAFFYTEKINLSKLESMPIVGQPYRYQFVLDLEFEQTYCFEQQLEEIKKRSCSYKVLGYYQQNHSSLL